MIAYIYKISNFIVSSFSNFITGIRFQGNRILPSSGCHSPVFMRAGYHALDLVQPSSNEHVPLRRESCHLDFHFRGNDISKTGVLIPHMGLRQTQPTWTSPGSEQVCMTPVRQENTIALYLIPILISKHLDRVNNCTYI